MPSYTYKCPHCGHFEYFQGIKEAVLTNCPTCHAPVVRVIGHVNVVLKTDGFYSTDHKSSSAAE